MMSRNRGFTLVEMVIVVSVILVLVALVVPAATALWGQRRVADAENTLRGLLMVARARALQASGVQTGLFFHVDADGVQRITPIEQADASLALMQNVFHPTDEKDHVLPAPMRASPRYIVEPWSMDRTFLTFSDIEVQRTDGEAMQHLPIDIHTAQRHRNFFTMIYSSTGDLVDWRDVLIQDMDEDNNGIGDRTRLPVGGDGVAGRRPIVPHWYQIEGPTLTAEFPPPGVGFLVVEEGAPSMLVAVNFPSVDGLMVYDDADLVRLKIGLPEKDGKEMREALERGATPFYVSRHMGAVIRGPLGEAATP
ncbi:MAG: prepilin-type N-terminal cleavage/methylation domain-containing protein [Planctomycetota bacterium]